MIVRIIEYEERSAVAPQSYVDVLPNAPRHPGQNVRYPAVSSAIAGRISRALENPRSDGADYAVPYAAAIWSRGERKKVIDIA